mmetsp:Transcript_11042/g.14348  ORF Transcript_11042/g.14348 Transcript_11042/m.14348 type:complete len:90 (-) Transcript_11042:57-326(-)
MQRSAKATLNLKVALVWRKIQPIQEDLEKQGLQTSQSAFYSVGRASVLPKISLIRLLRAQVHCFTISFIKVNGIIQPGMKHRTSLAWRD